MNLPENLEKLIKLENELVDVPLSQCTIEHLGENEIIFKNVFNQRRYKGTIKRSNNTRTEWFSAFADTVLENSGFKQNGSISKTIELINHLINVDLNMYIKFPFFLRVNSDNSIYGMIGRDFTKTDKLDIHQKVLNYLQNKFDSISVKDYFEGTKNKVVVLYKIKRDTIFRIVFGNDSGYSGYNIQNYTNGLNEWWFHNDHIQNLYNLIDYLLTYNYISKSQSSLNLKYSFSNN